MSYCINPECPCPQNPDHLEYCRACGSGLVYDEFLYRAIQPLDIPTSAAQRITRDVRLYEVMDDTGNRAILKVLNNQRARSMARFEQEITALQQLAHLGIPRFERAFTFTTSKSAKLGCLVMEKVDGVTLEQFLEQQGVISATTAVEWLKQLVEILYVVHQKGFVHRDIKPTNILRKPDGQLVLIDFGNGPDTVSAGYTPPEQADGKAVPQSDFFALGRTFVHLLTGKHPIDLPKDLQTGQLLWRPYAPQVSPALANLIDDLMAISPSDRPPKVQAILARVNAIMHPGSAGSLNDPTIQARPRATTTNQSPKKLWRGILLSAGCLIALAFGLRSLLPSLRNLLAPGQPITCQPTLEDFLSCGEESLFPVIPIAEKQQGIAKFQQGEYERAIAGLEAARARQMGDPETLIYLNNARLANQPVAPYTIAVVAPIKNSPELSAEILRGVAQAQDQVNHAKGIHGRGLRVVIADDANDPVRAKQVAEALAKQPEILGVLGHYTSEMSLRTLDIYQTHQLVLISYGSTSTDLTRYGLVPGHVFFRTVPTTQVSALALTIHLIKQSSRPQRVAVFYNPQSPYSRSLYDQFKISIRAAGGEIAAAIDLCQVAFNAGEHLNQAQAQAATAIALFPDGRVCAASFQNVVATIRTNNRRYPMLASWSLSRADTLENIREYGVEQLVVASPWHRLGPTQRDFLQGAEQRWGTSVLRGEGVNAATAMAYDATQALIAALAHPKQPANRAAVQQILADSHFQAEGATGTIRFSGGDREESATHVLLKVVAAKNCNHYGYAFVPINHPAAQAKNGLLDCLAH